MKLDPNLLICIKTNSKWLKGLNARPATWNLSPEKHSVTQVLGGLSAKDPCNSGNNPKNRQGTSGSYKVHASGNKHMKRSPMKGGLCDVFDRGLIPRKRKTMKKKSKHQRTNQHGMNRQFSKCKVQKANKHSKESSVFSAITKYKLKLY